MPRATFTVLVTVNTDDPTPPALLARAVSSHLEAWGIPGDQARGVASVHVLSASADAFEGDHLSWCLGANGPQVCDAKELHAELRRL